MDELIKISGEWPILNVRSFTRTRSHYDENLSTNLHFTLRCIRWRNAFSQIEGSEWPHYQCDEILTQTPCGSEPRRSPILKLMAHLQETVFRKCINYRLNVRVFEHSPLCVSRPESLHWNNWIGLITDGFRPTRTSALNQFSFHYFLN